MDFRTTTRQSQSDTKQAIIANLATVSDVITFDREYRYFKIAPVSITGLPAAVDINFLVNGRQLVANGVEVDMTHPDADFVWTLDAGAPVNDVSISIGVAATADVVFQITGYA